MFTNPDCTCTPFIPELCPVCQAEMPPKTRSAPVSRSPVSREHLTRCHVTRGHLTPEHFWTYDRIEALEAHNADLLAAAEALLSSVPVSSTPVSSAPVTQEHVTQEHALTS